MLRARHTHLEQDGYTAADAFDGGWNWSHSQDASAMLPLRYTLLLRDQTPNVDASEGNKGVATRSTPAGGASRSHAPARHHDVPGGHEHHEQEVTSVVPWIGAQRAVARLGWEADEPHRVHEAEKLLRING